ncbi:MAG: glutaredoxin family protein [Candidatus Bipolaricaulota bacterium]|nr:glutathione S-transferase N-terminal domain-containing protein [Candidatus Bipolaricaulota bacterium]
MDEQLKREVIVYSTPTCPWCQVAKRYLEGRGIAYTEVDVSADHQAAMDMVRRTGQQGVPVIEIDGEFVIGFDKARLDALLG